jgi:hypothetical protein
MNGTPAAVLNMWAVGRYREESFQHLPNQCNHGAKGVRIEVAVQLVDCSPLE